MSMVYVVTSGSYSDERIAGVFSTRENAADFVENSASPGVNDFIMEFEMDGAWDRMAVDPFVEAGWRVWSIGMQCGDVLETKEHSRRDSIRRAELSADPYGTLLHKAVLDRTAKAGESFRTAVFARDEASAIKIAAERRAFMVANEQPGSVYSIWRDDEGVLCWSGGEGRLVPMAGNHKGPLTYRVHPCTGEPL